MEKREVAIKELRKDKYRVREEEMIRKISRENCKNFVRFLGRAIMADMPDCLVYEKLGGSLAKFIVKRKLNFSEVMHLSLQVCDALIDLKRIDLIHYDIKTENILIKNEDELTIKVIDVGAAKDVGENNKKRICDLGEGGQTRHIR